MCVKTIYHHAFSYVSSSMNYLILLKEFVDITILKICFIHYTGQWNCEACRISNPADKDVCVACTTPKPSKSVTVSKTAADLTGEYR